MRNAKNGRVNHGQIEKVELNRQEISVTDQWGKTRQFMAKNGRTSVHQGAVPMDFQELQVGQQIRYTVDDNIIKDIDIYS
jgi:hypothetical protein